MAAIPGKDYTIGKGRLYFDLFAPSTLAGSGERYFGNTPEMTLGAETETLDHYDADEGVRVKDRSITIEDTQTGSFVTDNMDLANIGLFFGGDPTVLNVTAATGVTEVFSDVKLGRYIQLGTTALSPTGARKVTNVVVSTTGGSPVVIAALNNYEVDLALGRIYIESDSVAISDGDDISVTYDITASARSMVVGKGSEVVGSLRFVSTAVVGTKKDYYWPYVKLTPNGDFSLKGEEWQQVPFSIEILKKDAATERVYIEERLA